MQKNVIECKKIKNDIKMIDQKISDLQREKDLYLEQIETVEATDQTWDELRLYIEKVHSLQNEISIWR